MRDLELAPFVADIGPLFAPIEIECPTELEHQRHIHAASSRLFRPVPVITPTPQKGRRASVGAVIAELHQISVIFFTERRSVRDLRFCASNQADNQSAWGPACSAVMAS